ncbi:hypothetical protein OGY34_11945 [Citrobacter sp. Cy232]|uniref:hypothetical protein n=1 Tax=Citrobacter sp. Cy232 TaxID=2985164 RepID=UPI002576CDD7|nr:hypothetical protein [Citrobacter sp. Cy232]MDM2717178.1 hypothetical protein [Citrobacter sp. Cy232]
MTTIGKPTYEELEKKCALQQSKLAAINELMSVVEKASDIAKAGIEELQSQNADMAVQLANAESKCRELAAENVTLNDKMNKLATWPGIEFYSSAWEFCNLDGNDALEFMCDVKTPATDAFLAEVRAQGVEGFLTFCGEENSVFVEAKAYYRSLSDAVDEFAAQLRQGAKS